MPKHRNDEFLKFLKKLHRETDKSLAVHVIVDNYLCPSGYATHKHPNVKAWLAKYPRFHLHFTPTSASWLNLVERFFRDITEERIRPGIFRSVEELKGAIMQYLEHRNANPKPYHWTAPLTPFWRKSRKLRNVGDVTLEY
ncbi:MAG: transposase [Gammaproteobacteria bacterium]